MHDEGSTSTGSPSLDPGTRWLASLGLDISKAAAGLYLLGTFASLLYYARFSILTLDLMRAQAILVGLYICLIYCFIPALLLVLLRVIPVAWVGMSAFVILQFILDIALVHRLNSVGVHLVGRTLGLLLLQLCFFVNFSSVAQAIRTRAMVARVQVPDRPRTAGLLLLASVHFAYLVFPSIPMNLGGAQPLRVMVFTKTPNLSTVRLSPSKPSRKFNALIDSYPMDLLYESDKDFYFLTELKANGVIFNHLVTRMHKDEIERLDYETPLWVTWR